MFLIDGGTTNTRVWLDVDGTVKGPAWLAAGARNTAIEGSNTTLKTALAKAFRDLTAGARPPGRAVAAGMITSRLGLCEVPHCPAPAGAAEIAAAAKMADFPEFSGLEFLFVAGVRCGRADYDIHSVAGVDVIRGEETEVIGALALERVRPPALYIHVGSHTKGILVDGQGRIADSVSTLGGELLQAARANTILGESVADGWQQPPDAVMLRAGAEHGRRYGLNRALFIVRLLDLRGMYSSAQLDSFLLGACIAIDLKALEPLADKASAMVLSAPDRTLPAWRPLIAEQGWNATVVGSADRERSFVAGAQTIARLRLGQASNA